MLESVVDALIIICLVMSVLAVCTVALPRMIKLVKQSSDEDNGKIAQEKKEFLSSSQPGKNFIKLIYVGVFSSLKTGNHGNDFPDKKQIENFKKYSTQEINKKVMSLEVSHEEFII